MNGQIGTAKSSRVPLYMHRHYITREMNLYLVIVLSLESIKYLMLYKQVEKTKLSLLFGKTKKEIWPNMVYLHSHGIRQQ